MAKILQIKSYRIIYLMGFLTALSSFIASYTHVFLSQLENFITIKEAITAPQTSIVLTLIVSASFMGEIIGNDLDIKVPSFISPS